MQENLILRPICPSVWVESDPSMRQRTRFRFVLVYGGVVFSAPPNAEIGAPLGSGGRKLICMAENDCSDAGGKSAFGAKDGPYPIFFLLDIRGLDACSQETGTALRTATWRRGGDSRPR